MDLIQEWRCKWCEKKFKCQMFGLGWTEIGPICSKCYLSDKYKIKEKKKKRKFKVKFAMR